MKKVGIHETKSNLPHLAQAMEMGSYHRSVIARDGRPAASLTDFRATTAGRRIEIAKGKFIALRAMGDDARLSAQASLDYRSGQ